MNPITFTRDPAFHLRELLDIMVKEGRAMDGDAMRHKEELNSSDLPLFEATAGGYYWDIDPDYKCGFHEAGDSKVLGMVLSRLRDPKWETRGDKKVVLQRFYVTQQPENYETPINKAVIELSSGPGVGWSRSPGAAVLIAYLVAWGRLEPTYPSGFLDGLREPDWLKKISLKERKP